MNCPLCKKESNQNHLRYCKLNVNNISLLELKKMYLEYNYPDVFGYDNLYNIYINQKMSLPDIKKIYNISYRITLFMLSVYEIQARNHSEGAFMSMDKRENTNIERYGAKNVLSKGTIKYDKRNKTVRDKYGVDNVFQIPEIIEKINDDNYYLGMYNMTLSELRSKNHLIFWKSITGEERINFINISNMLSNKTNLEKYGGHPIKNVDIQNKIKAANLEKYGTEHYFQSKEFLENNEIKQKSKSTRIKNGYMIDDVDMKPFLLYKRKCRRITYKFKKILFEKWDGYDYYDNEYIKDNLNLKNTNTSYPTIDHKISIFYGFINSIDVEKIGDLDNLCITKRRINCSKGTKCKL